MEKGILGRKIGMTQIVKEQGEMVAVTVVEAGPCAVIQKKNVEKDGYDAVQIGFDGMKLSRVNKPKTGHFKKANAEPKRFLKEFKFNDCSKYNVGDLIKVDVFEQGDLVDVSGTSKGKGFAGSIKRHGNHMLKKSHGTGPVRRQPGPMSGSNNPSRIFKGKKMPGHMGNVKVTIQKLRVAKVDVENNLIAIEGAIPGPNGKIVSLRDSVKVVNKK